MLPNDEPRYITWLKIAPLKKSVRIFPLKTTHQPVHWRKICFRFQNQRCTTSVNLKICDFTDDPFTIISLPVCVCIDELCSTSMFGWY